MYIDTIISEIEVSFFVCLAVLSMMVWLFIDCFLSYVALLSELEEVGSIV